MQVHAIMVGVHISNDRSSHRGDRVPARRAVVDYQNPRHRPLRRRVLHRVRALHHDAAARVCVEDTVPERQRHRHHGARDEDGAVLVQQGDGDRAPHGRVHIGERAAAQDRAAPPPPSPVQGRAQLQQAQGLLPSWPRRP
jgi:hypothetical protein